MHITAPTSWTPLGIIRWLTTAGTAFVISVIFEENIRHVSEERHWNRFLSDALAVMPDLSPWIEARWFWFVFGFLTAIASALWLVRLFSGKVTTTPAPIWTSEPQLRQIINRTFRNERVLLDGISYVSCRFENVTFVFNGIAPFGLANNHLESVHLASESPVVLASFAIMVALGLSKDGVKIDGQRTRIDAPTPVAQSSLNIASRFPTNDWEKPLLRVFRQSYENETVELDGKSFVECKFKNVSFRYSGTKSVEIIDCQRIPDDNTKQFELRVISENPVVLISLGIMRWAGVQGRIEMDSYDAPR
jgi:hypothetical protein